MILRRIIESLKNQDIGTLIAEVIVVVLGIFIGLQVDDWNQDRKDRIEERQYLERLHTDLESTIAEIDNDMAGLQRHFTQGQATIQVFRQGELGDVPRSDFELGILVASRMAVFAPQLATIDELIASGRLGIIKNPEIRAAIASAKGEAERQQAYVDLIVGRTNLLTQIVFTRVLRFGNRDEDEIHLEYDLAALLADKAFQNAFGNMVNHLNGNRRWLADLRAEMVQLLELVAKEIAVKTTL